MSDLVQIVDLLENKVSKLLLKLDTLQQENINLMQQCENFKGKVNNQQQVINDLQHKQESLKIANTIVGSKGDKHVTKLKINTLIREIDRCIIQLSD
ncbi:MAG: hypothetical protein ABFR05_00360 [Bacteroidota bacterium]